MKLGLPWGVQEAWGEAAGEDSSCQGQGKSFEGKASCGAPFPGRTTDRR